MNHWHYRCAELKHIIPAMNAIWSGFIPCLLCHSYDFIYKIQLVNFCAHIFYFWWPKAAYIFFTELLFIAAREDRTSSTYDALLPNQILGPQQLVELQQRAKAGSLAVDRTQKGADAIQQVITLTLDSEWRSKLGLENLWPSVAYAMPKYKFPTLNEWLIDGKADFCFSVGKMFCRRANINIGINIFWTYFINKGCWCEVSL